MNVLRILLPLVFQAVSRLRVPVLGTACAAIFICVSYAQTVTTGDVTGTVKDPTGAVVPRAKVVLKNTATGEERTQTIGGSGEYRFTTLRPGTYQISAESPGLTSQSVTVLVAIGQVQTLDLVLNPESSKEVVQVTEGAELLQNDNANLATSYGSTQLQNLPAPGNDITSYAFSAPGVTISTGGGYGNFSAFGMPAVSNLFTVNGNDNMDPYLNLNNSGASNLSLGSNEISEAVVVLNGYTGQYGRQAGANVNYVTKSGTNDFHGNAAWWYNERVLNANDWFNNATGTSRPFAVSNEWADSFGGPIKKNKLFFFVDNEGLRYVLPGGGPVYIPTSAFSSYVLNNLQTTNPNSVSFYQNALNLYANSTGAGRATPVTVAIDPALGCGSFAGTAGFGVTQPCAATFRNTANNLNTEWLLNARVDYNVGPNDQVYFRFNTDHGLQATHTDPISPTFNVISNQPQYGGQIGWTKTLSGGKSVNQLLLSSSYYSATFGPPNLSQALATFPTTWNFQDGLLSNLGGNDYMYPQGRKVRQMQLIDDFSHQIGTHTLGFGTNIRKNFVSTYAYGYDTSGLLTFNSMSDFVNGNLNNGSTYEQAFTNIGAEPLTLYSAGFYAQDQWKVRPNLTLTLAIRLDRNSNIRCAGGCFNELRGQPFAQVAHSATTPYNATIQTGVREAFPNVEAIAPEPRIGFAWNPTKNTVLRGGFGIFTDLYQGLIADRLITNSPGYVDLTTSSGGVAPGAPNSAFSALSNSNQAFQSGFASGATLAQLQASIPGFSVPNFNTVGNKLYNPKFKEWNFEVQQQLTHSLILSANYVGNHGYQLINQTLFANAYAPGGFQGLPTAAPDARFGEIRELNNNGWSNYDGVVANLRWRFSSTFTGSVSYTWSHALDTCSNECLEPFNFLTATSLRYQVSPLGLRNPGLSYGSADYDVRHSLNANYVYTVPASYFHNRWLKSAFRDWTAAGTFYFHTGYPFSIVNTAVRGQQGIQNGAGIATLPILADYVGGPMNASCTTPNVTCFSTSQFATAAAQQNFGNINRNSFRGPNYFDTDLNLNRTFSLTERFKFLIGANFYNILNHPNFDLPVNNVTLGNFGQITNTVSAPTSAYGAFQGSAVSGRVIQFQTKLTF
jgi:outer membrane receptor protein involved in Fe transport